MKASLVTATYNMPKHLALVFAAMERQSAEDFEILVCDDGSGPETEKLVEAFALRSPFPVKHFWQENKGFRKCRILNTALHAARGETMIFIDGDTIPHRHYVRDHLALQEKGRYVAGRRMMLGEELSAWLTPERVRAGFFDHPSFRLWSSCRRGDSEHFQRSWRVPWMGVRRLLGMDRIDDLIGCNYSVPRAALEAINGFDEEYEGYGREDTDVEIRLQHLGLKIKSAKGMALQFHVWHPRREFTPANDARLDELKKSGRVKCERGLCQISPIRS